MNRKYSINDNATPGHCVVCGYPHKYDICNRCLRQYATRQKSGKWTLPDWLHALVTEQHAKTKAYADNAKRLKRGIQPIAKSGRGGIRNVVQPVQEFSLELVRHTL